MEQMVNGPGHRHSTVRLRYYGCYVPAVPADP